MILFKSSHFAQKNELVFSHIPGVIVCIWELNSGGFSDMDEEHNLACMRKC